MHLAVVIPLFDDWACVPPLLRDLEAALAAADATADVLLVDDGSSERMPDPLLWPRDRARVRRLAVLELARNLGQERAIAIGLCHTAERPHDLVLVLDGDGEDPPAALAGLLAAQRSNGCDIVVASRLRRHESWWFRACYQVFKAGFRLATGQRLDHGHFSLLTPRAVQRLIAMHELWISYAASLLQCRLPVVHHGTDRGNRYRGRSHMNVVALIVHGVRAASVFLEQVYVRAVLLLAILSALATAVIVVALALKVVDHASPGWASNLIATSSVIVILSMLLIVGLMGALRAGSAPPPPPVARWRELVRAEHGDR